MITLPANGKVESEVQGRNMSIVKEKRISRTTVFEGHLKVINMSRTIENARETVVRAGYTYVPLEFFREFLNETIVESGVISVSPQMCELD